MTACKMLGLSPRYFTIQVSTLAVVSRAAKMTPIMLSAIWSSESASWASMKEPSRSLLASFVLCFLLEDTILATMWASCFLAFIALKKSVPGKLMGMEL